MKSFREWLNNNHDIHTLDESAGNLSFMDAGFRKYLTDMGFWASSYGENSIVKQATIGKMDALNSEINQMIKKDSDFVEMVDRGTQIIMYVTDGEGKGYALYRRYLSDRNWELIYTAKGGSKYSRENSINPKDLVRYLPENAKMYIIAPDFNRMKISADRANLRNFTDANFATSFYGGKIMPKFKGDKVLKIAAELMGSSDKALESKMNSLVDELKTHFKNQDKYKFASVAEKLVKFANELKRDSVKMGDIIVDKYYTYDEVKRIINTLKKTTN